MKRGIERKLVMIGATWNLFTSLMTLFGYYRWFNREGSQAFQGVEVELAIVGTSLIDNISRIILTFGLFIFVMAIVNFLVGLHLKDGQIQTKIWIWLGIWAFVQLLTSDVIGFLIFMFAFVIYLAKNKAIRLANTH
ncbi:hypothetical protein [Amphibacillus sediminis]|uniref:hypothetical protein n=1 Tax=Amphibacillus sediminis TaxID=360185 RepID=UPI0008319B92|nr:hypothetical protein [Amphibacillus sediminis]